MITNLIKDYKEVSDSNIVFVIKNKIWLEDLSFLNLDENIIQKLNNIIDKQENTLFTHYLWREDFENLYVIFYLDINKDFDIYLWSMMWKLPKSLTFEYKKDEILLDNIVLWKYEFTRYKKEEKELILNILAQDIFEWSLESRLKTLQNIIWARDIVNTTSNDKTPEKYVNHIKSLRFKNTKIKILDYDQIKKEWLNLLEAVGRWSVHKPYLVILERIVDKKLPTIGFVWKGITYDTGWLDIKPTDAMYDMKLDMAWSAWVLYMMKELDEKNLDVNIIRALSIAENAISWDSYRPSDIYTSYSWKTVEIWNTDAEGRLILADGISYISKNYKLESITTMATLTWACMVALWSYYTWVMWDHDRFIKYLTKDNPTFEKYWQLPMDEAVLDRTKWTISDLVSLDSSRLFWASFAGAFLSNFRLNNEKFMHLDIAWPSFQDKPFWLYVKWATWFGVDSLSKMILSYKDIMWDE